MAVDTSFTWGTGRRKSAVARVRIRPGQGQMVVNKKKWDEYLTTDAQRISARQPLVLLGAEATFDIFVNVNGGGPQGQADAVRHGLARALVKFDQNFEAAMREAGFMTRDSRQKERKKYGQKGARARYQFSKR